MANGKFAPMKGEKVEEDQYHLLDFPHVWGSNKEDGIRGEIVNGKLLSAASKPIPNLFIRNYLEDRPELEGADGELIIRNAGPNFDTGPITSIKGEPDFEFRVFDLCGDEHRRSPFKKRWSILRQHEMFKDPRIVLVRHVLLPDLESLLAYKADKLAADEEGFMTRHALTPYKMGKASINQQNLLKFKFRNESDCIIVDFYEMNQNNNAQVEDAQGRAKRSSHKDNKSGKDTLGGFVVRTVEWGEFRIGIGEGLDAKLRKLIWENKEDYRFKFFNFTFQRKGMKDKPRQPSWHHFRDEVDMDPKLVAQLRALVPELKGAKQFRGRRTK